MKAEEPAIEHLRSLSGADFDRELLQAMVDDHEKAIAKVDADVAKADDPALVSMLRDMQPVLQKHLDTAKTLLAQVAEPSR